MPLNPGVGGVKVNGEMDPDDLSNLQSESLCYMPDEKMMMPLVIF